MMRCKDCRFWGESTDQHDLPNDNRPYWKSCHKMAASCLLPFYINTLAFAYETGETDSQVLTSPEFGCVMFEHSIKE